MTIQGSTKRLIGLDLLRLISFAAIYIHDHNWFTFYTRTNPLAPHSHFFYLIEVYARSLSFSGFTILSMTCILHGANSADPKRRRGLILFLFLGWLIFALIAASSSPILFEWDIYPLILLGLLSVGAVERLAPHWMRVLGIVGLSMLFVQFWNFPLFKGLPLFFEQMVIGNCAHDLADWPILPWLGLFWCSYAAGAELRRFRKEPGSWPLWSVRKKEVVLWVPLLMASIPHLGQYYGVPLGEGFACFIFRQGPEIFWSHLIWVLFVIRLSFDPWINSKLQSNVFSAWVSELAVSRHFWLAYLLHYVILYLMTYRQAPVFLAHIPWAIFVFCLSVFLLEMVTRLLVRLGAPRMIRRF